MVRHTKAPHAVALARDTAIDDREVEARAAGSSAVTDRDHLAVAYRAALTEYLRTGDEQPLLHARDMGHDAIVAGLGLLEIVAMHNAAMLLRPSVQARVEEAGRAPVSGREFLAQSLVPFEMASHNYRAENAKLQKLNARLERRAAERTATMADRDATQAGKDAMQVDRDATQAGKDAMQVDRDATQAGKDAMQVDRDATLEQSYLDRTEVLRASETHLLMLAENAQDAIFRLRFVPEMQYEYLSMANTKILGYSPEELLADASLFFRSIHPDDQPLLATEEGPMAPDAIFRFIRKDGEVIWLETRSTPFSDPNGDVVGIEGIARDITARKLGEESIIRLNAELVERIDEFQTLFDVLPVAVGIAIGPDSRTTRHNAGFDRLFGDGPDAKLPETTLVAPSVELHRVEHDGLEMPLSEHPIEVAARDGVEVKDWEGLIIRADGTEVNVLGSAVPLWGADGNVRGSVGAFLDISEMKQAIEARRANQAKSEFLSRMSHELRTPLSAILGFGQLLEINAHDPQTSEAVGHILGAGRHLLHLIDEVLELSRIEAGRLSLATEPVLLREVVQESLDFTQSMAAEREIDLLVAAAGSLGQFVMADRQRLQQVLLNLLSNAIKYNRQGGTVTIRAEARPDDRIRLWVRDTGRGISANTIRRLFSPFDRLGAETSGIEGTGLGLALSKRLVEAMGGTIGVDSRGGQGSDFWIELPRADNPLAKPTPQMQMAAAVAGAPACTVLYIEDNVSHLTLIERILSQAGNFRFLPAMQGSLGLELARQHQPDLILLDLNLPDIQGMEVLAALKGDTATREIPVTVISADASPHQPTRLIELGAHSYLTKPLDVTEFLEAVATARKLR